MGATPTPLVTMSPSPSDPHTAAHEAAHVVQQRAGVHLKGGVGSEVMSTAARRRGRRSVVRGESAEPLDQVVVVIVATVQRQVVC